ncbi:hypothetical protein [Shewanella sp.]|uniref:hypothetical protein n=1 Tax=Shewanella sp. TaxID=50422 RepID=UPI0040546E46
MLEFPPVPAMQPLNLLATQLRQDNGSSAAHRISHSIKQTLSFHGRIDGLGLGFAVFQLLAWSCLGAALVMSLEVKAADEPLSQVQNIQLLSSDGKPQAGVIVYLQPQFSLTKSRGSAADDEPQNHTKSVDVNGHNAVEVHQNDKQFTPYISVVQSKRTVSFVNDDNITHHIYSALGPKRFSLKLRAGQKSDALAFDDAGHVSMGCNIHDWMSGHLLVVDTPFYGISDRQGQLSIKNLPQGDYQVVIWHPQLALSEQRQIEAHTLPKAGLTLTLSQALAPLPEQKSLDDFDFLEGY